MNKNGESYSSAIVQLKVIAKERGIRGYYKLRKVELIHALEVARLIEQKSIIFDESIPNVPPPILQQTTWRPSNIALKVKQNIKQNIKDVGQWLLNYIPPKPKTKLKKCMKRGIRCFNQHSPNLL